jgi:diadenosine tetraphosphate (Ap4A) HIT family hydrolase
VSELAPSSNRPAGCEPCRIAADLRTSGRLYELTPRWTMNAAVGWDSRPWLVLQTATHRSSLADIDDAEATEIGPVTRALTAAVTQVVGAERVYLYLLNEAQPPHVHFHVVARFPGDPLDERGPRLLGTPAAPGAGWPPETAAAVAALATDLLRHHPQTSSG